MKRHILVPMKLLGVIAAVVPLGCSGAAPRPWGQGGQPADKSTQYTVMLRSFSGPGHLSQAERYKQETERHAGWTGLSILSEADHSCLCWGRYPTVEAAQSDLKRAKAYVAPAQFNVYAQAIVIPLPGKDVGPPEWRLENAPGAFSVVVAVFYNMPEAKYFARKDTAVDYCRQLRSEGKQAYYYHGVSRSAVTVGSFPESAIQIEISADGKERRRIVSPRMADVIRQFKYLALNGHKELVLTLSTSKRALPLELKAYGSTEAEAIQALRHVRKGKVVTYQSPYPVRVPRTSARDAPRADHPFGQP